MKHINKQVTIFIIVLGLVNFSCKKILEIDSPKDAATPAEVFANDATATSAITGIYSRMASSTSAFSGSTSSIAVMNGLSADELISHSVFLENFYKNQVSATTDVSTLWVNAYQYIYSANAILAGLETSTGISDKIKKQLEGEAKFIRAFCNFYLVNIFGDVPLNLTTDYVINGIASRSSEEEVYAQITKDLIEAENLLANDYVTVERIRPNKWVAKALLSRVYLYMKKFDLAIQTSTEVIDQNTIYSLVNDLDKVFLKNSSEAIWQLMPTIGGNTQEGASFILTSTPTNVSLSPNLMLSFEMGDNRKLKWTNQYSNTTGTYYFPFKYKIKSSSTVTEYSMVIRLAEMHLIRAEARAKLNLSDLALEDLNLIRKRAGMLTPLSGLNSVQCIAEVEKQRRFELFSEWGHRWLDLKRTDRASAILSPLKGPTWQTTDILYPIPSTEISTNPNMFQNPGY